MKSLDCGPNLKWSAYNSGSISPQLMHFIFTSNILEESHSQVYLDLEHSYIGSNKLGLHVLPADSFEAILIAIYHLNLDKLLDFEDRPISGSI